MAGGVDVDMASAVDVDIVCVNVVLITMKIHTKCGWMHYVDISVWVISLWCM